MWRRKWRSTRGEPLAISIEGHHTVSQDFSQESLPAPEFLLDENDRQTLTAFLAAGSAAAPDLRQRAFESEWHGYKLLDFEMLATARAQNLPRGPSHHFEIGQTWPLLATPRRVITAISTFSMYASHEGLAQMCEKVKKNCGFGLRPCSCSLPSSLHKSWFLSSNGGRHTLQPSMPTVSHRPKRSARRSTSRLSSDACAPPTGPRSCSDTCSPIRTGSSCNPIRDPSGFRCRITTRLKPRIARQRRSGFVGRNSRVNWRPMLESRRCGARHAANQCRRTERLASTAELPGDGCKPRGSAGRRVRV